jgi:hypothetical protein
VYAVKRGGQGTSPGNNLGRARQPTTGCQRGHVTFQRAHPYLRNCHEGVALGIPHLNDFWEAGVGRKAAKHLDLMMQALAGVTPIAAHCGVVVGALDNTGSSGLQIDSSEHLPARGLL